MQDLDEIKDPQISTLIPNPKFPIPITSVMLFSTATNSDQELKQILTLQEENLLQNLDDAEMQSQGFVTLHHSLDVLQQMHRLAPSIIIKDDNEVVAYALVMLRECRQLMPPLEPMFALLDQLHWNSKLLKDSLFYVMGQICVDKAYRGKGLVEMLYNEHKNIYSKQFDFVVTEISTRNHRSLRAHERIGFETIYTHSDELDEWNVVLWDWV